MISGPKVMNFFVLFFLNRKTEVSFFGHMRGFKPFLVLKWLI